MTKKEAMRQARQESALLSLGFTQEEAQNLRRISMTLQRWHELECGNDRGYIERDPTTDRPYLIQENGTRRSRYPVADRETGARRRLGAIINARNIRQPFQESPILSAYIQTDPRGAALYILRPGDVPEGKDPGAYYSRGVCVY